MSTDPLNFLLEGHLASLYEAGEYEDALRVASTAVTSARDAAQDHPENQPKLLKSILTLARLHREFGDIDQAESLYKEALTLAERVKVPKEESALIRSGLATLYDFNDRESDAIPYYEQAIQEYEALNPPRIQDSAQLRNNLGMIYKSMSKYSIAEQHYLIALENLEKVYGRENEKVATLYNNLGGLYYAAGFPEQAMQMHTEALRLRKKVFSDFHPEVAQSYCNIASAYYDLEKDEEAISNYESGLDILERHVSTASETYEEIAADYVALLKGLGQNKKASDYEARVKKNLA